MVVIGEKFFVNRVKKNLLIGFSKRAGRNFFGRKTVFTQSGGLFKKMRVIDFFRILNNNAMLLTVEKDIDRTAYVGLVCFENGLYTYFLLYHDIFKIGSFIHGFVNKFLLHSSTFLFNIPTGNFVHHIELKPGLGAKLVRAAGTSSFLISEEKNYVFLKMNSGWLLKISKFCIAVSGIVSNIDHHITRLEKAGKNRKLGFRPKVRGVAMNPCDHPHGGGEGTGSPPAAHKTPWGKMTKIPTKRTKRDRLKRKLFKKYV
jgi:large subunit ribosomal protein L2